MLKRDLVFRLIWICVLFLWSLPAFAQVDTAWVRRYNGSGNWQDFARDIAVDTSGNVYVTGASPGSGTGWDYATIKYDPNGSEVWVRTYNGPGNSYDFARAIALDPSGNVYVTGSSAGVVTNLDYATIKYDSNGSEVWVTRYSGHGDAVDGAEAIAVDASGNVYVTGASWGSGTNYDYATIKYDPNGSEVWVRTYDPNNNDNDLARAIAVDASGNVYVTGHSYGWGYDYGTIKYDPRGREVWVRRYNGPDNRYDFARAIALDPSGNVYVTGYSYGRFTDYDYATIKYDQNGIEAWVRTYSGPGIDADSALAIAVDASGNVYVTGSSGFDYGTIKYDPSGSEVWVRTYNGPVFSNNEARAIAVDPFGNVYVTGASRGSGTGYDYATIKYDPNGIEAWVGRYNGPGNSKDLAQAIAVDASGNVYVTGASLGSGTSFDYATIKYVQVGGDPPLVIAGPDTNPEDGIHDDSPFDFNETISFAGQVVPAGGAVIDSTRWDFDDGVSIKDQLNVQHQFTGLDGGHTAILTAWDNWGLWASDTLSLWILTAEPPQVNSISALHDGITHEDTIGTFISGFTASNTFYAVVTEGSLSLDSVVFEVASISTHGTYEGGGVWTADFADIGLLLTGDNTLTVTAYDVEGNPAQKTAIVKMRDIPSWFGGEWISLIEHHEEYEFVTTDGTPYYYMEISIPEPPVEWGPYDFSIEPFFPDLSNHFRVFLGIQGRFNIDGLWSDHEVGGELIAKLLGKGIDENVNVEEGDMRFEGPYNDLVGVTISGLGYEIPNQTLFGASGWLATFWVGAVQIDLFYSAAFGLQAYIDLGAEFSIDTNYDSYVYLNPGIQPWVSLDVWASVLFGVAEIGMNFTPTFGIEFPCTLFVYPDPHAATHHCTYFVLYYSVWGSVGWGLWKGTLWGPEAGFHFDEPEGCHWGEYEFEVTPPIAAMIDSVLQYLPQVFETPSAAVDPNSNRAFVVWVRDEHPEDTLLTDPEVYYGFLDSTEGAAWVPGSITDNDRWETNPKVAFLSSDSVIAVWTQNEIPKADWGSVTELNTVLSNQELYYSIWTTASESWTVPVHITTNSLPDGCADLHARNGKAILAWVRDPDGNLNTRADWEVFYSWYDTSGWSTPTVLSEGLGSNFEPAVALDDSTGQAIVVWTHEPDGDFNSPDDRSLYYKYIDPVTGPGPLGTDLPHEMGPFSPSVAFAPGSNPAVAYTCRSVEWDSVGAEWDTLGVGLKDKLWFSYFSDGTWDSMRVTVDGGEVIAMNPVVKVDNQNRAMIVYRGFEGEGVAGFDGEIFSVYIDLSSGAPKGENHVQYTSDTTTTWMPAFDINSEGEGKLVYVSYSPEPPDTGFDNMHIESPAWWSQYLRGDANGDQTIDVGDVVYLVSYLYRSGSAPDPLWTGDANCDLVTNVGDIVYLINYLYRGGDPPPHCG